MTTTFFGIPIDGDINPGEKTVPQRPAEEFAPLLFAVLADPYIVEVGWEQYTPYFNDGEPCVFSVYEPWVITTDDDDVKDRWSLGMHSHPSLKPGSESYASTKALTDAIESGAFHDVLLDSFGDHAKIRVTKDKIHVSFYSHD